jgi:hypothetical protein
MLTKKIANFSDDLLNTVRGILGEAKKCSADCECPKCEAEEMKEGSMPTADEPTDANKKTADKVRAMMAKEKKPIKEEDAPKLPFDGPYRKAGEERKDEFGNKVKNVAKHLAKKAMKANEEAEHANCGTPECCGQCDTPEQIDEVSKGTLGRYINKAKDSIDMASYRQGHKEAHGSSSKPLEKKLTKRHKGISTAVSKLTKEEQDFIDSLNNETFEEVEITEARGRPKKTGAKDFTIHPKTKEKMMHNNPEHMKRIERLQKNGILEKPKREADQHIMNQLSKAKTSMRGGETIHFTHGESKHVSGTHAAKLMTKYAGMKPSEKEDFQKNIGHSHENLMKHV